MKGGSYPIAGSDAIIHAKMCTAGFVTNKATVKAVAKI